METKTKNLFGNTMRALALSAFALLLTQAPVAHADDIDVVPFNKCSGNISPIGWSDFKCPLQGFVGRKPIDLLWVVDNSGSMAPYQANLIANAQLFINALAGGNAPKWKIGIISTTDTEEPFIGFTPSTILNYQNPNAISLFQQTIGQLGIDGSTEEKTIDTVINALDKYPDFLRPNANLGIVMVTDEREQSSRSAPDFLSYLAAKKGSLKNVSTYGLIAAGEWGCMGDNYAGSIYEQIILGTNGKTYPLCQATPTLFSDMMTQMLADMMSNRLQLPSNVNPSTIQIFYNSVPALPLKEGSAASGADWEFDASTQQIVFHDMSKYATTHRFLLNFKVK